MNNYLKLVQMSILVWILILSSATVNAGTFTDFLLTDQTPAAPMSSPVVNTYHARYVSGFGQDNVFTVFFEDRSDSNRIKFVTTTSGPEGFTAVVSTNISDTHFLVKPWPITVTVGGTTYAYRYRAWAAVGNNPDHRFYVSNDLVSWVLVSTFQISNTNGLTDGYGDVYYGFHDVIRLNGTFYAFAETNTGHTVIVRSSDGDDSWEAFAHMGGINGQGPLGTPASSSGWTARGNFFDLGADRGYGKIYIDPGDSAFYLAVNSAAKTSLSQAELEAAFINPANWTWNNNTTGTAANPIAVETSGHDLRECWLVPRTVLTPVWTIIYDADFGSANGGKALGYFGPVADLELIKTLDSNPPFSPGDTVEYTITVTNSGPNQATNVRLSDSMINQQLDSIQATGCPSGSSCSCGTDSCTIDKLDIGASATFKISSTLGGEGIFSNIAEVVADQLDPDPATNSAQAGAVVAPAVPTLSDVAAMGLFCLLAIVAVRRETFLSS